MVVRKKKSPEIKSFGGKIRSAIAKGFHVLGSLVKGILNLILKIGKPILFIIGFALSLAVIVAFAASIFGIIMGYPFMNYLLPDSPFLGALGIACLFILISVPLLTLINLVQRISMNRRIDPKIMTGSWLIWGIALAIGMFTGSHIARDFKVGKEITQLIPTENIYSDTLRIEFAENPYSNGFMQIGPNQVFDDELINTQHRIRIIKGKGDDFEIIQKKCSQGRTISEAEQLAYGIRSEPITTFNSVILPSYFSLPKGTKYRGQHLETIINVPEGKHIEFTKMQNGHGHYSIDYNRKYDQPWAEEGQIWRMTGGGLMLPSYAENPNELSFINFDEVEISGDMEVEIEQSDRYEVSMRGRKSYKKQVEFKQEGNKLKIDFDGERRHRTLRLFIKTPELAALSLYDTDNVKIEGFDFESFDLKSSGSQEVRGKFNANNLKVNLEKRTKLWLDGEGNSLNALVEDRSNLYADDFDVKKANIKTKDREWKRIQLSVLDTLIKDLNGHEEFHVEGKPWILDKNREEDITDSE